MIRDKNHLARIRRYPCLICQNTQGIEAHHLLRVPDEQRGMGLKTGDNWAVPLCNRCHQIVHAAGNEAKAFGEAEAERLQEMALILWNGICE